MWTAPFAGYYQAFLAVADHTIILVAPGGETGSQPAIVEAFDANGAKLWNKPLGGPIADVTDPPDSNTPWGRPLLPIEYNQHAILCDTTQIPGFLIVAQAGELSGFNLANGQQWQYSLSPEPERIVGPNPGEQPYLHLVSGADTVLVDGRTGREVGRNRSVPKGHDIGGNSAAAPFDGTRYLASLPKRTDINPIAPYAAASNGVVYGDLFGPLDSSGNTVDDRVVAIDTATSKVLWTWQPKHGDVYQYGSAAGDGFLVVNANGTTLLH